MGEQYVGLLVRLRRGESQRTGGLERNTSTQRHVMGRSCVLASRGQDGSAR